MPRDHFDIIAPVYEHFFGRNTPSGWVKKISATPGWKVLDAGGGTGRVSGQLAGEGILICVSDVSQGMLREARSKPGLCSVLSCTEALPYPDKCFDFILMTDAYHHVADQKGTVHELWRVLKPGGQIMLEEPDINRFSVKIVAILEKILLMRSHFEQPQQISQRFESLGGDVQVENDGFSAFIWVSRPDNGCTQ